MVNCFQSRLRLSLDMKIKVDFQQVVKKMPKLFVQLQHPNSYDLLMVLQMVSESILLFSEVHHYKRYS